MRAPTLLMLFVAGTTLLQSGCSVMMAARAPGKKDLSLLTPGVARSQLVAELGTPQQSREKDGTAIDVFAFKQGYSLPVRMTRAVFHGAADVATIGIWEIASTPLEAAMQGEDVRAEVLYDHDERIRRVQYYSGAHLANGEPTLASWMRIRKPQQQAVVDSGGSGFPDSEPTIMPATYSTPPPVAQ